MTLGFYKGNVLVRGRTSPNSLYDAAVASMEGGGSYDQTDAEGFLRIQGLPSRVLGKVRPTEVLRAVNTICHCKFALSHWQFRK